MQNSRFDEIKKYISIYANERKKDSSPTFMRRFLLLPPPSAAKLSSHPYIAFGCGVTSNRVVPVSDGVAI